jgi:hypothetical protein
VQRPTAPAEKATVTAIATVNGLMKPSPLIRVPGGSKWDQMTLWILNGKYANSAPVKRAKMIDKLSLIEVKFSTFELDDSMFGCIVR